MLRMKDYGFATIAWNRSQIRGPFLIGFIILCIFATILAVWGFIEQGFSYSLLFLYLPGWGIYRGLIRPFLESWWALRKLHKLGFKPADWTFSADGIRIVSEQTDSLLQWSVVTKSLITADYVLLQLSGGSYHTFACSMFETPVDWHDFRSALIRNFIGCRACGYDLRGTQSDRCPECGLVIE
ncbi:MAG: YcxB family protein [Phycisphaerales bacterium]